VEKIKWKIDIDKKELTGEGFHIKLIPQSQWDETLTPWFVLVPEKRHRMKTNLIGVDALKAYYEALAAYEKAENEKSIWQRSLSDIAERFVQGGIDLLRIKRPEKHAIRRYYGTDDAYHNALLKGEAKLFAGATFFIGGFVGLGYYWKDLKMLAGMVILLLCWTAAYKFLPPIEFIELRNHMVLTNYAQYNRIEKKEIKLWLRGGRFVYLLGIAFTWMLIALWNNK
jgi:hypothetical protein